MSQTVLEDAVAVRARSPRMPRNIRILDAQMLNEYGIFSKRHLSDICDLPMWVVEEHVDKSTKVGGNLNPEMLPLLLDFRYAYDQGGVPVISLLKTIIDQGVSLSFASKLLEIPKSTMQYWLR